jgi:hypothetical protein
MTSTIKKYLNQFVVVETENDVYMGTLGVLDEGHVVIRSGYVGRPGVVRVEDVEAITLAELHPDVAA